MVDSDALSADDKTYKLAGKTEESTKEAWNDEDFLGFRDDDNEIDGGGNDDSGSHMEESASSDSDRSISGSTVVYGQDSSRKSLNGGLPPWMNVHTVRLRREHPTVALHNEILQFARLVEPTRSEMDERRHLVKRVRKLALTIFPKAKVDVFGSQATGLVLPSSDIDIMICTNEAVGEEKKGKAERETLAKDDAKQQSKSSDSGADQDKREEDQEWSVLQSSFAGSPLQRFAAVLREKWISELSYLEVLEHTKVPLVKFTIAETNLSVDVCFDKNDSTGPAAAALMQEYLVRWPPLRPLALFLKYFLAVRGLNEPYSGGVGSYLLQLMIVSFLQHREKMFQLREADEQQANNLGCLLLDFFELYGVGFNYLTTGISVRHSGRYFPKGAPERKSIFWEPTQTFMLSMEHPLDPTIDVGKSSFRMRTVHGAFAVAYKVLLTYTTEPKEPCDSVLAGILPVSDALVERACPVKAKKSKKNKKMKSKGEEKHRRKRQRHA